MKRFVRAAVGVLTSALVASAGLAAAQAQPMAQGQRQAQGSDLPTLLHLRPDQMAAYHAVEAADRESPTVLAQLRAKAQRVATQPFPQRLDFAAEVMTVRVAHDRRVWDAQRKFYAVLTPDQQRSFDQITAPPSQQVAPPH